MENSTIQAGKIFITQKVKKNKNIIMDKLIKKISKNYAKIIDDFCNAYLASRWKDYFSKQKKIDFRRLELVIKKEGIITTYFYRLKKGKLKKLNNYGKRIYKTIKNDDDL